MQGPNWATACPGFWQKNILLLGIIDPAHQNARTWFYKLLVDFFWSFSSSWLEWETGDGLGLGNLEDVGGGPRSPAARHRPSPQSAGKAARRTCRRCPDAGPRSSCRPATKSRYTLPQFRCEATSFSLPKSLVSNLSIWYSFIAWIALLLGFIFNFRICNSHGQEHSEKNWFSL
jgi:hypothetical protein